MIPASVKFREAYARGTPLIHYDRFGAGAEAYRAAARAYLAGGRPDALADTAGRGDRRSRGMRPLEHPSVGSRDSSDREPMPASRSRRAADGTELTYRPELDRAGG